MALYLIFGFSFLYGYLHNRKKRELEKNKKEKSKKTILFFTVAKVITVFSFIGILLFFSIPNIPQVAKYICIAGSIIAFIAGIVVEMHNPNNNYSIKRRFWKFALQSMSFIFSGVICFIFVSRDITLQDICNATDTKTIVIKICSLLLAALFSAITGKHLFYATVCIHAAITFKNGPRANSKDMKALRNSPKR